MSETSHILPAKLQSEVFPVGGFASWISVAVMKAGRDRSSWNPLKKEDEEGDIWEAMASLTAANAAGAAVG